MKDRITNQLDMAGACINVATKPEYQAVWNVTPPLDFVADFATFQTEYASITAAANSGSSFTAAVDSGSDS